jgi:hypothetical protein
MNNSPYTQVEDYTFTRKVKPSLISKKVVSCM